MANASDQLAVCAACQRGQRLVARLPFHAGDADFDQFVIVQRLGRLGCDCVARASVANEDDGFQRVRETSKMSALFFGKLHRGIVPAAKGRPLMALNRGDIGDEFTCPASEPDELMRA